MQDPVNKIQNMMSNCFFLLAFLLALFPSVIKMYETSHWFREEDYTAPEDPSVYDDAKEWFSNPAIPFQPEFDNPKVLMRVYFFIIPYIFSALCVTIALSVQAKPSRTSLGSRLQPARRVGGSFLRRTLTVPSFLVRVGMPLRISVGELLCTAAFLTLNILTLAVRVRRSLPRGSRKITFLVDTDKAASKEEIDPYSFQACEVWAKTLGVLSIVNLGWYLLMPIGRKSVLLEALGMSWDQAIKYHRWVGYYSVAIMFVHGILYIVVWVSGDGHATFDPDGKMIQRNMVPWYCSTNECTEDESRLLRVNMYGFASLTLVLVMTAFALPWVRRRYFEWFYYVHHLFILVLVFVCLHYKGAIIYLIPGIALYAVDKLMALYSYRKMAPVRTRMVSSDVVEMSFDIALGVDYKAGDYVFLNVPAVSFLQWHPFSLTSAPTFDGQNVFFHMKNAGSWTKKVIEAAKNNGSTLQVRLDGFYGVNGLCDQLQRKDGVIFVGGGIGVTPMISLAVEMCEASTIPVTLIWIVRTIDEFSIFSTELADAQRRYKRLTVKIWITLNSKEPNHTEGMLVKSELLELDHVAQAKYVLKCIGFRDQHANEKRNSSKTTTSTTDTAPNDTSAKALPAFVFNHQGLSGATNAAVMTISMLLALVAFALASKHAKARKESFARVTQDEISLTDLAMVCGFVVVWIGVTIAFRRALMQCLPSGTNPTDKGKVGHTIDVSTKKVCGDVEVDGEILQSMIKGRIGCRPNITEEISLSGEAVTQHVGRPVDITVLACGPQKLVESINNYINGSFGLKTNQRVFYSFTEEDWEW